MRQRDRVVPSRRHLYAGLSVDIVDATTLS